MTRAPLRLLTTLLTLAVVIALGVAGGGCSFVFGKGPPSRWQPGQPIATCNTDHEIVAVDGVLGSLLVVGGALAGSLILATNSDGGTVAASAAFGGAIYGLLHVFAALKGHSDINACRLYHERAKAKLPWPLPQEAPAPSPTGPSPTEDEPQRRRMGD